MSGYIEGCILETVVFHSPQDGHRGSVVIDQYRALSEIKKTKTKRRHLLIDEH